MANTATYKEVNDPAYRIDEVDQARERIAARFHRKIELVKEISKAKAELYLSEMEDNADRYLIRELNKSPYSSLKVYFRNETRDQPAVRN
jgi:hypothetical protein